jgi:hypothetical protein
MIDVENHDWRPLGPVTDALEEVNLARLSVVDAPELSSLTDGPVHRHRADAKRIFYFRQKGKRTDARVVHFVHESENGNSPLATNGKQFLGLGFHALGVVDEHDRAISGS